MGEFKNITYQAEPANITKDGKQIRIIKKTEDTFRPDETTQVVVLSLEQAKGLHHSLGETILSVD